MEKESQIIRLPKKYGELINSLNNEEAGKIIKEIFWYKQNIEWLSKIYFDMINVDLLNLESSAMNWWKWWRPKKEKPQVETPGYEKRKPQVMKNDNLKERIIVKEEIKEDKENVKEKSKYKYFTEYMEMEENKNKLTYKLLVAFFDLWYIPAHEETTVSFRRWFEDIMKLHWISDEQEIEIIINWFHTYWKESGKKIKNFKSTFGNNPLLNKNK